jgi:hypothetical protein
MARHSTVLLILVLAFTTLTYADTSSLSIFVEHHDSLYTGGDWITYEVYPYSNEWAFGMSSPSSGTVTGPRIEFTSDRFFKDWAPYHTGFVPQSTYVWDYPAKSITEGEEDMRIEVKEGGELITPKFMAARMVDDPMLVSDVCEQTMMLTLRFIESPQYEPINGILVKLGTYPWDQTVLNETVMWQNSVPGWLDCGDGTWWIDPWNVIVGADYNFQVQVQCIKNPEYQGISVFHKPAVFIAMWQWDDLSEVVGPSISVTHPEGETVTFRVNESVSWQGYTTTNKQEVFLRDISVPVDGNGIFVDTITTFYGREYDGTGAYLGRAFEAEVSGDNIVTAEVTMPTGRTWSMQIDDEGTSADIDFRLFSLTDLRSLGVVSGLCSYSLSDHLGNSISTVLDTVLITPFQPPCITFPINEANSVGQSITVSWDTVWDSRIDTIYLSLESDEEDWELERELPPDQNSFSIAGLPPNSQITCEIAFVNTQIGQISEGINWVVVGYTAQEIHFTTSPLTADLDADHDVDFVDFARFALSWRAQSGEAGWNPDCDISSPQDGMINELDLGVFSRSWLVGK